MRNLLPLSTEEIQGRFLKAQAKRDYPEIVRTRMALLQYDDYNYSGSDSSGGGDALSAILQSVGTGLSTYGSLTQSSQYGPTTPVATPIYTNAVSAHATSFGSSSLLWIIVLLVIGIFAYREL